MLKFFPAIWNIPFPVFSNDKFCQISHVTDKTKGNLLACL